jgi:hypothetical protein
VTNWPSSNGGGDFFLKETKQKGAEMSSTPQDSGFGHEKSHPVSEETLMKIAKEIAIKFIEMGRLTPATFDQTFKNIYATVKETANKR